MTRFQSIFVSTSMSISVTEINLIAHVTEVDLIAHAHCACIVNLRKQVE